MDRINDIERMLLGLAEQTRLRILNILKDGEASVTTITESLRLAQPKISRHLAYLRESGVAVTRRDGKQIYYRLADGSRTSGIVRAVIGELENVGRADDVLAADSNRLEHASLHTYGHTHTSREPEEIETYLL